MTEDRDNAMVLYHDDGPEVRIMLPADAAFTGRVLQGLGKLGYYLRRTDGEGTET